MFSDHYSDFKYPHLLTSVSDEDTFASKKAYERVARAHGVMKVQHYHADNSRFNSKDFQLDCDENDQTYSYCSVGAHHQNAIAEAKNKTLSYDARKLLLRAI